MAEKNNGIPDTADREISATRILNAPRELVWKVWTDPAHIAQWWGPNGFTNTIHKMDVRPDGEWNFIMHGPDGVDYANRVRYREVVPPERLVYQHGEMGQPDHFQVTVTFAAEGNQTRLVMRMLFDTPAKRDLVIEKYGAREGLNQNLDRLENYLARESTVGKFVIAREFDAPRALAWKTWTELEHLQQWFGPKGCTVHGARLDLRPDGVFHYSMQMPDGNKMWGKWVFREIVAPERIVLINSFSDASGNLTRHPMNSTWPLEMLTTTTFIECGGKTLLTVQWSPHNATAEENKTFDASHDSMQHGWTGTFEQLQAYLVSVGKKRHDA